MTFEDDKLLTSNLGPDQDQDFLDILPLQPMSTNRERLRTLEEELKRRGLGDRVQVKRAGEVIRRATSVPARGRSRRGAGRGGAACRASRASPARARWA